MSTIREREGQARCYDCPRCGALAGAVCRSKNRHGWYGPALRSVHPERLALLPFELTWHRATEAGQTVWLAVDNRQSPHVVYQVGKGEVRYGYPWYVACWREGVAGTTQRHTALRSRAVAQRLAEHSRCQDCGRSGMFGDMEPMSPGSELFRCRDRESCEAVRAEADRAERELIAQIERQPYDELGIRPGRVVPELYFTTNGIANPRNSTSTVVRLPEPDVDRLWYALTRHRLERDQGTCVDLVDMTDALPKLAREVMDRD